MSRRGSKRRHVVQLDASSSNLHRYGYSKSFMSSDAAASSLKLLGDYSDSESEESVGDAENIFMKTDPGDSPSKTDTDQGPDSANGTAETEHVDDSGEKGAATMDDELKNFLSEIEAIPMPTDLQTASHDSPQESPSPAPSGVEEPIEPVQGQTSSTPPKKADKKRGDMYSMFIKGDTEFADHSNGKGDGQAEQQTLEEDLDIPEEPTTHWQLVQDEATQYYYYWNWHTNEVTWEIPADYTQYLLLHKEYEEKISKYTPEQIETFKEKQRKQNIKLNESKPVPSGGSTKEKIGLQLPNGNISADPEEAQESNKSGHIKKKKSHKKHKKRRHKDEEFDDEPQEPLSKSSTSQTGADKQLPQLISIVPYLSDEENENKDTPAPKVENDVSQKDLSSDPLTSKEEEPEDSIDLLLCLNTKSKDSSKESSVDEDGMKTAKITTDVPLDKDQIDTDGPLDKKASDMEGEEEVSSVKESTLSSETEILLNKENEKSEEESTETNMTQDNISNLNSENIEICQQLKSLPKNEAVDLEEPLLKKTVASEEPLLKKTGESEKDGDSGDCKTTEHATSLEDIVCGPENGKQEVEEGEISDSNDGTLKCLDANKTRNTLPNVGSQKNVPSKKELPQGRSFGGTLLNLIDYKSDDNDEEEEDEEEEGELREYKSHHKEIRGSSESRDCPLDESHRGSQRSHTHKSNDYHSQEEHLCLSNMNIKTHEPGVASSHIFEGNQTNEDVDDTDIDFDDVEDIDRVLEMALEKKMDKKKVNEGSGHVGPSATNEDVDLPIGRDMPKQTEEIKDKMNKDQSSKGKSSSKDSDDDLQDKIKSMTELAINKLDFLEVGANSLSKLQILYVELQTRMKDWNAGGLSTNYIYQQLQEAEGLIEQYEVNAVPDGWLCQWDRTKRRYFYRNTTSNQVQLEYPQADRKTSKEDKKNVGERKRRERESSEVEESHRQHASSRSSRHRKKEDKERSKHDRRSSDRHRKKRRRRRNHSSSSDSSNETSHQHHHKSKRKKKRKSERSRSPSVEVIEGVDMEHAPHIIEDSPPSAPNITAEPILQQTDENSVDSSIATTLIDTEPAAILTQPESSSAKAVVAEYCSEPDEDNAEEEQTIPDNEIDGMKIEEEEVDEEEGEENEQTPEEESNTAIISKPPQIIVPSHIAAMNPPELYSFSSTNAATTPMLSSQSTTNDNTEELPSKVEDNDKAGKKRKKEKAGKEKTLTTGSSLMMKKKRVSSMVQKWQQVKKEVEKEDLAKELRQAAIREQINQLK